MLHFCECAGARLPHQPQEWRMQGEQLCLCMLCKVRMGR